MSTRILASDPVTGLGHMLRLGFVQHALIAGTAIALLAGLVGYFVVLRAQVFAADAQSHVAFTGSLAALAAGADLRVGLFAATVVIGLVLGLLGGRAAITDDVVIGTAFAWILGLGTFFLTLYTQHHATGNSAASVSVLFGSIFGISATTAWQAVAIAGTGLAVLAGIARPLLFATVDPAVARARGVPVRTLGALFLALLGVAAAEATQAVGALLLLGLVAAPAGAAHLVIARPWRAFAVSGALAVAALWAGVCVAYAAPSVPVSFAVMIAAALEYAVCAVRHRLRRRVGGGQPTPTGTGSSAAAATPSHSSLRSAGTPSASTST